MEEEATRNEQVENNINCLKEECQETKCSAEACKNAEERALKIFFKGKIMTKSRSIWLQ